MTLSKKLFAGLALGCLTLGSIRAEEQPVFIQFVRPLGMGGAFTAVADDHNIFSYNPAGMVQRTGAELTIFELAVGASQDFKDAFDFIDKNQDDLDNFENLSGTRQQELTNEIVDQMIGLSPRLTVGADVASLVTGPKFFGIPVHGGFGLLGGADASFEFGMGLVPNISYQINTDVLLPLSFAKRFNAPFLPGTLGVGLTGKVLSRAQVSQDRVSIAQLDNFEAPDPAKGKGVGADLGLLYQPTGRVNVGVMVQDIGGTKMKFDAVEANNNVAAIPERDTVIRPRTNIGVALVPEKLLWILPTGNRLTLAADVRDLTADGQHMFFENGFRKPFGEDLPLHVYVGAEYRWWFLRLRGGASQGYPSFGLGVDLPILKLDYAFYSRELGARAGDIRQGNHVISLALKFGAGYTEARERIRKGKQVKDDAETAVPQVAPAAAVEQPAAVPAAAEPTSEATPAPSATPAPAQTEKK